MGAYKQAVGARRSALRVVQSAGGKEADAEIQEQIAIYTRKLQGELQALCTDVIQLVKSLVPGAADLEAQVYYMKMEGDYNRYLAEFCPSSGAKEAATQAYDQAWSHGKTMPPTNAVLLGLALNRSVFLFEVMRLPDQAKQTANEALQNATRDFNNASPDQQAEARQIMDLLSDNLQLWGAPANERTDDTVVEDF